MSDSINIMLEKAKKVYDDENYEYSYTLFEQIVSIDNFNKEALHLLHLSNIKKSLNKKTNIIKQIFHHGFMAYYFICANMNYLFEDYTKSLYLYEKALIKFPNMLHFYYKIAEIYCLKKDYESGINIYNEILFIDPENIKAMKGLCKAYLNTNNLIDARQYFNKLEKIIPGDSEVEDGLRNLDALQSMSQEDWK